jgi:hypothetical protein
MPLETLQRFLLHQRHLNATIAHLHEVNHDLRAKLIQRERVLMRAMHELAQHEGQTNLHTFARQYARATHENGGGDYRTR